MVLSVDKYKVLRTLKNPKRAYKILKRYLRLLFWNQYARQIRDPKVIVTSNYLSRYLESEKDIQKKIDGDILSHGIQYKEITFKQSDFENFIEKSDYLKEYKPYRNFYSHALYEKILEHFAAVVLFEPDRITTPIICIDIASERSVAPDIYRKLHGWQIYRQDLAYEKGIHREYIGGDASSLPLPEESVHLLTLHCSFEHFEGDSDIGLIREAQRLLKPGGRVVIVPLYLSEEDRILTDPVVSIPGGIKFPDNSEIVCIPYFWNRFARLYSIKTLKNRVLNQWSCGRHWIVHFVNSKSLHPQCHLTYGLVLEKQ